MFSTLRQTALVAMFLSCLSASPQSPPQDRAEAASTPLEIPAAPEILIRTNVVVPDVNVDLDSFPVDRLADQLRSLSAEERANERRAQEAQFDAMERRMAGIERGLEERQTHEFTLLERLHKFTLTIAVAFAAVGLIGIAVIGALLWRSNNRLAELASGVSGRESPRLLATAGSEREEGYSENSRLLGALDRLDRRIVELEAAGSVSRRPLVVNHGGNGASGSHRSDEDESPGERGADVALITLIAKGETEMNLGDHEAALRCFNDAEKLSPDNPELLLKKGSALEKLKRMEQAIAAYDRAIELSPDLTMAFLHKGRAFNRMSRFDEALQCYERALKTQR